MEGLGRKSNSITHSILPVPLLTQVWLQRCVTLVQKGYFGSPGVPQGALSQRRWQSSITLHSQAQKSTTNTIKTPSPASRLGSAVACLAAELSCVRGHSYRTGIPLPQYTHFHLNKCPLLHIPASKSLSPTTAPVCSSTQHPGSPLLGKSPQL